MLNLEQLDDVTRSYMRAELLSDLRAGVLHRSPRLTASGWQSYKQLLFEAVERRSADWLAEQLEKNHCLRAREYWTHGGVVAMRAVPSNAAEVLADDVINRYYIRAICLRKMKEGKAQVQIYRARAAKSPRPRSMHLEGMWVDAEKLLQDLRRPAGEFVETGVPAGPGSGLSVR